VSSEARGIGDAVLEQLAEAPDLCAGRHFSSG
jgi:hypothetical protein